MRKQLLVLVSGSVYGRALFIRTLLSFMFVALAFASVAARAQDSASASQSANGSAANGGADAMENLFSEQKSSADQQEQQAEKQATRPDATPAPTEKVDAKKLSDLAKLSPFSDVAVLQKRYLPRTGRFELAAMFNTTLNDAFFNNFGVDGRFAYYFSEKYGISLDGMAIANGRRDVTKGLASEGITTTNLVTPKSYLGLDFQWVPIYGKIAWLDKKITHIDTYFSFGVGSVAHSSGSSTAGHLGMGQNFALSQSWTIRWDFSYIFYNATSNVPVANSTATSRSSSLYNNLFLGIGVSWFFPEASYR